MGAIAEDFWQEQADDPAVCIDGRVCPEAEDAYWQGVYRTQSYYRPGYAYDDYAPAFCVGYIGRAQYGGRYEDAEKSLCANWLRIKGDSRLELDEALPAIRAAWDHAAAAPAQDAEDEEEEYIPEELVATRRRMPERAYAIA